MLQYENHRDLEQEVFERYMELVAHTKEIIKKGSAPKKLPLTVNPRDPDSVANLVPDFRSFRFGFIAGCRYEAALMRKKMWESLERAKEEVKAEIEEQTGAIGDEDFDEDLDKEDPEGNLQ